MSETITAWSYSRYSCYKQCPGKAKLLYVEKLKEPGSVAMTNGLEKHTDMEHFLKGYTPLPEHVNSRVHKYCEELKAASAHAELQVAFNDKWQPVEWFGKTAWARIKIDALVNEGVKVRIVDWKTGKIRDGEYDEQLELYALTAFLMFPSAQEVSTELVFIEQGVVLPCEIWKREDMEMLRARWEQRINEMTSDTVFEYTPNQWCGWCHFRKANGGPCDQA